MPEKTATRSEAYTSVASRTQQYTSTVAQSKLSTYTYVIANSKLSTYTYVVANSKLSTYTYISVQSRLSTYKQATKTITTYTAAQNYGSTRTRVHVTASFTEKATYAFANTSKGGYISATSATARASTTILSFYTYNKTTQPGGNRYSFRATSYPVSGAKVGYAYANRTSTVPAKYGTKTSTVPAQYGTKTSTVPAQYGTKTSTVPAQTVTKQSNIPAITATRQSQYTAEASYTYMSTYTITASRQTHNVNM